MMIKQRGFSLLEILVAFSILALSLSILLKIFSTGVNTAITAEQYTTAVQIAESVMAKTGVESPLKAGQSSGVENNDYHWSVTVSPFDPHLANLDVRTLAANLFKIKVVVTWGESAINERAVELTSLKLMNKPL
jgi:general secretion pathway protein I